MVSAVPDAMSRVTPAGIARARASIDPVFLDAPQFDAGLLAEALGARTMVLKVETLNPVRSFKGRGADYCVATLVAEARAAGTAPPRLVCASAGNFGQAIAWSARRRGVPATVFAAEQANPLKLERMRAFGAEVVLAGADFDAAKDAARAHAATLGAAARFVEDGRELSVTEGAGTIGMELARWAGPLDAVLVPLGNGALLAGLGHWLRAHRPEARLVAVCAAGAPAMADSIAAGTLVRTAAVDTIADGIAVREPVPEALDDLRGVVDEVVCVPDDAIVEAMRLVLRHAGVLVEPAGAVGVAAALVRPALVQGRHAATPLCGSNLTAAQLEAWR
jgi:threonine dehydratase